MSSLPKQHNLIQTSSSRQSPFRAANTASANPSAATSRPRPIGHLSERKLNDASYTQLGDNSPQLRPHEGDAVPERPFEDAEHYDDDHANRPKPASNFKPFFTLIEDSNSSDYHHPTVHYIFSDDDAELMTEASLRVLETGQHYATSAPPRLDDGEEGLGAGNLQSSHHLDNHDRPSLLPPPVPGVKERFIILDVEQSATAIGNPSSAPDALLAGTSAGTGTTVVSTSPAQRQQQPFGYRIASAHSLTPDWQVLDATLSPAPTFDTPEQNTGDQASVSNTLMLRIQGTGGYAGDVPVGKDREGQQTLEEMMEQFDKRMAQLRRVIETSGEYSPLGATATAAQQGVEKGVEGVEEDEGGQEEPAADE